jgi:hypothetical protein
MLRFVAVAVQSCSIAALSVGVGLWVHPGAGLALGGLLGLGAGVQLEREWRSARL